MASFTNAADVLAAAVEIERRGFDFYRRAAESAAVPEDRDFFSFMSREEQRHEKIFEGMLRKAGGLDLPAGSNEAEYLEYVDLLLDSHCLFMPGETVAAREDPLRRAIAFEKDTILFFSAMLRLVSEADQVQVRACIEEEQGHIRLIAEHGKARAMAMKG